MNIIIVGCGSLGSWLSFSICLRSLETKEVATLTLIDLDTLEPKNLPYLFLNRDQENIYIGQPKCKVLQQLLTKYLGSNIKIRNETYEYKDHNLSNYDSINIDCRDSTSESSDFNFKLNIDSQYSMVITSPSNKSGGKRQPYIFGNSKYYSMLFSNLVVEKYIFKFNEYKNQERKEHLYDLKELNSRVKQ